MNAHTERRRHVRTCLRLLVECQLDGALGGTVHHGVTLDLSSGGIRFETDSDAFAPGMPVRVALTIPPGEGHSPYRGRVQGVGEVKRVERRGASSAATGPPNGMNFTVAAGFAGPVECLF